MSGISTTIDSKIKEICGPGFVFNEPLELKYFSIDGLVPRAVAAPGSVEEALSLVTLARENNMSVIPRGGGVRIRQGKRPESADLVILTSRLGQVIDLEPENLTVVLGAGIPVSELEHRLAAQRVFLPVNPYQPEMSTPGGVASTDASGQRRLKYGTMRDHILGLKMITGEAVQVSSGAKTVKNVAGYDISKLVVGSLGTLGLITELTLRLEPMPEKYESVTGIFEDLAAALEAAEKLLEFNPSLGYMELFCRKALPRLFPLPGDMPSPDPGYSLFAGAEGTAEIVAHQAQGIQEIFKDHGARDVIVFGHGMEHEIDWLLQEACFEEQRVSMQLSHPPSGLQRLVEDAENLAEKHSLETAVIASLGSGEASLVILDNEPEEIIDRISSYVNDLRELCKDRDSRVTIHNAPNSLKERVPVFTFSDDEIEMLAKIKKAFDPDNMFSPSRMF